MENKQRLAEQAYEVGEIARNITVLNVMLDALNKSYKADLGHETIFTYVYWLPEQPGYQQATWMCKTNDGLGGYAIGYTFEDAVMWFMQRARSLGIEYIQSR